MTCRCETASVIGVLTVSGGESDPMVWQPAAHFLLICSLEN